MSPAWSGDAIGSIALVAFVAGVAISLPDLVLLPLLAALVFGSATASGWFAKALSHPTILWAGTISYSLYMTHTVSITLIWRAIDMLGLAGQLWLAFVAIFSGTIAAAALTYYVIEEPARRVMTRVLYKTDRIKSLSRT